MMDEHWEVVDMVQGQLQAEILRGLLEAQQIKVWLNQEGAGAAYGINVGPLGTVEILVPASELAQARRILDAYYAGEFEGTEMGPIEVAEDDLDDLSADDEDPDDSRL